MSSSSDISPKAIFDQDKFLVKFNVQDYSPEIKGIYCVISKQRRMVNLILCIDFKKAFDSIDHTYINSTLKILNFGETFRNWVLLLFQ